MKSKMEDPVKFHDFPEAQLNEGLVDKHNAEILDNWKKAARKRNEVKFLMNFC